MNNIDSTISVLISLGRTYTDVGGYEEAVSHLIDAYVYADSLKDVDGLAASSNNLGVVYAEQGNLDKAIYHLKESIEWYRKAGSKEKEISGLLNLGIAHIQSGNFQRGTELFEENYDLAVELGDQFLIANSCLNLSGINFDQGKLELAKVWIEKAISKYTEIGYPHGIARAYGNLCSIYQSLGDNRSAEKACDTALQIADSIGALTVLMGIYDQYMGLHLDAHDYDKAFQCQKHYITLKDSLFSAERLKISDELERKYRTKKMSLEISDLEQKNRFNVLKAEQKQLQLKSQQNQNKLLILIIVSIILVAIIAFIGFQFIQQKKKARLREKALELEQRLLRSQMNPHFIFNSMNAIQSYISDNNSYQAEIYLSKLAQLMRNILHHSRTHLIALDEEISALELYLELEKGRFQGLFEFTIDVDPGLDREETQIPPLMLQPYVENSILHGMQGLDQGGLIKISFQEKNNRLLCHIEDNGIGRKKAKEIKKNKGQKHESVSMVLTQERLELLEQGSTHQRLKIVDLIEGEKASGTRVELNLPLNYEL